MVEICVCAEPLEERGLYPCSHALCLSCTLKKRVLMKDMNCPYCRSLAEEVAVLDNPGSSFEDATIEFRRGHLRVENDNVKSKLHHILQYPCPECDVEQHDLKRLKKHLQQEHDKTACDVCTKNEFNFSDEFITYRPNKIKEHLKKRHVFCKYCRSYFYGTAEFAAHCKKVHVACDICERRDPEHPQYFEHYTQLRNHYQDKHYRCMEAECLANMHIVFGTAVELQKHMVEAHHKSAKAVNIDVDPADNSRGRSQSPTVEQESDGENEEARYVARLEIVAEHNQDKVAKIRGANTTFLNKKVPVEIFIATYESVLKKDSGNSSQITLLLMAFAKAYGSLMPPESLRSLNFKLYQRDQAEQKLSVAEQERKAMSTGSYAQRSGSSKSKGLSPVSIQPINWGAQLPRTGGINSLAELPKLGSSRSTSSSTESLNIRSNINLRTGGGSTGSIASTASYANPNRPSVSLQDLPKLQKKSVPKPPSQPTPASAANSLSQIHLNNSKPHVNVPSGSSLGSSRLSSASSSSSSLSSPARGIQLNNLPSLPKAKKEEKKRQHNVIRMI